MFVIALSRKKCQIISGSLLMLLLVIAPLFPLNFAEAGTQTYSTAGTYSFTVPDYSTLTVKVWGGGAGAGLTVNNNSPSSSGGQSSFNGSLTASGGGPSSFNSTSYIDSGGTGGTATGGDTNISGNNGENGTQGTINHYDPGDGGNAPNGGTGGTAPGGNGVTPGAGGAGNNCQDYEIFFGTLLYSSGGGGSGAYTIKTYSSGDLVVGSSITAIVGSGAAGLAATYHNSFDRVITCTIGGNGADGRVEITWTDAPTDTDPPTPDPMTFATNPNDTSTSSISMTATTATDADGADPVEYLFSYAACANDAGTGSTSSSWQTSTSYTDSGLQANHCYGYTITARDALGNSTGASSAFETYSAASVPGNPTLAAIGETKMIIQNNENGNPSLSPITLFALQVSSTTPTDATWDGKYIDAAGDPSATAVWLTDSAWDDLLVTGLSPGTQYSLIAKAKNGDGDETAWSGSAHRTTLESVTKTVLLLGNIRLLGGVKLW